jgi:predicted GIY-YIG superfamily endonuclease
MDIKTRVRVEPKPDGIMSGEFYLEHNTGFIVYIWKRSTQYLYVGSTAKFLARIGTHNVINVVEPVLPLDSIVYWHFDTYEEASQYENYLIVTRSPKYNKLGLSEEEQARRNERPERSRIIGYRPMLESLSPVRGC